MLFRSSILHSILIESENDIYDGWSDWQLGLLQSCLPLATTTTRRKTLEAKLQALEEESNCQASRYIPESIAHLRYHLLQLHDSNAAAEEYLQQNIHIPEFRHIAMNSAMQSGDYARVEELALAGEAVNHGLRGLTNRWKEFRYEADRKSVV